MRRCEQCDKTFCNDCIPSFTGSECEKCEISFCNNCDEESGIRSVIKHCYDCDTLFCGSCRVDSCQEQEKEGEECIGCFKLAYHAQVKETKQLKSQVEDLKEQIEKR
jgi:hypothetical protein